MAAKSWITGTSGTWGNGLNWTPTGYAGPADDVTISGPGSTISGNGSSASMSVLGDISLAGIFATGALTVGSASASGTLRLSSGNLLASSATVLFGPLLVSGYGAKLTVTGGLTLGGTRTSSSLTANSLVVNAGAVVQVGNVVLAPTPGGNGIVVQDSATVFEVGTTGGAVAGKITVDANRTIAGTGSLIAVSGIANQGVITAQDGTLSIGGGVTGSGQLRIAAGATLYLMNGVTTQTVTFGGAGGTLELAPVGTNGLTETGTISGFVPGDNILYASSTVLTGATYQAGANGLGTLTLTSGSVSMGTLTLAGNYAGYVFQVTPSATYGTVISVVLAGSTTGTAGGGSPGTDAFAWTASGGSWNAAVNWQNTATLASGLAVPGSANAVTLNGPPGSATQTITGPGASASLRAVGNTTLNGVFTTGALTVGTGSAAGGLALVSGANLAAQSATVLFGSLQDSGAKLTVDGTLTLGGARSSSLPSLVANTLSLTNGAVAQVGGLVLAGSPGGNAVTVDAASSLEVGTAGSVAAGKLTVDAGRSLSGAGLLVASGSVVNQGTIVAQGGTLQIGSAVTGSGQLQIGGGATLSLYDGISNQNVAFAGASGTLQITLTSAGAFSENGVVSGFVPGDTIYLASSTSLTGVTYKPGANGAGTLTFNNGASVLGTIGLTGSYIGETFKVAQHGSYGWDVTVAPTFANPDPLFDPVYYLTANPDVAAAGINPYQHYMTMGWREGRDPSALFHTAYYLNQNPDVAAAGINPLSHFESSGWREGRDPSAAFSVSGYFAANPDVKAAGIDPLLHYMVSGKAEGRTAPAATPHPVGVPDPGVDYAYYYAQHPDVAATGVDASLHYHTVGYLLGYNPDPYFDTNFYLSQNPDVKAAGMDPLAHYETNGWHEGRTPSLTFSGSSYLAANPDVRAAGVDPLLHYLGSGKAEGRVGVLSGAGMAADPLVDIRYYGQQLGATLFPTGAGGLSEAADSYNTVGWQRGLNPDAFFDTNYYLSHNPDVAAAHINPLLHYEQSGWREGRDPSAAFSTAKYLAAYADVKQAGIDPLLHYINNGQGEGRPPSTCEHA